MVEISDRVRRLATQGGWIGVDLDGTLFTYDKWVGWNVFGEPIRPMVERVQAWTDAGIGVKIFTARVHEPMESYSKCLLTGEMFTGNMMRIAIQNHLVLHGMQRLDVTCRKDVHMIELWDDRAVQVVANTGRTLAEEHAAEIAALAGRAFGND